MKRTIHALAAGTALMLLLAGCTGGTAPAVSSAVPSYASGASSASSVPADTPAPDDEAMPGERYTIHISSTQILTMNRDGNLLPEEEESDLTILKDCLTGEPQCQRRIRKEDTGERDEYGNVGIRTLAALYDMEGNLLHDWSEYAYDAAFGDFLVRYNDPDRRRKDIFEVDLNYKTSLWNFKTGEDYLENVDWVEDAGNGVALLNSDRMLPMGTMDQSGKKLAGFPVPDGYRRLKPWKGYFIASTRDPNNPSPNDRTTLLTTDLTPLITRQDADGDLLELSDGYMTFKTDKTLEVLAIPSGEVVFSIPREQGDYISYFDGERAIITKEDGARDTLTDLLIDRSGTVLAEGLTELNSALSYDNEAPTKEFLALRDGKAELLDYDGKPLISAPLPEADRLYRLDGQIYYYNKEGKMGVLDDKLNVLIPAGVYTSIFGIQTITDWDDQTYPFLLGYSSDSGIGGRYNLLDMTGKPIIENLSKYPVIGPNRLAVIKGFEAGLMDWEGNWIAKQSIFTELRED